MQLLRHTRHPLALVASLVVCVVVGSLGKVTPEMITLRGGSFTMGEQKPSEKTGARVAKQVTVAPFKLDRFPVTNRQFREFVRDTKYRTDAEKYGWSFVFHAFVDESVKKGITDSVQGAEWWLPVQQAYWRKPFGPKSGIKGKEDYPAVQISWNDAEAYCKWAGKRLPSEAEWEYAARGGLDNKPWPWGDNYMKHRMNVWQGNFPAENTLNDGFHGVAPADQYGPQNEYGFFNMLGNAWEWTADAFEGPGGAAGANEQQYVLRGGSYLDSIDGKTNHKVRVSTRMGNTPDSGSDNLSFRCAADASDKTSSKRGEL